MSFEVKSPDQIKGMTDIEKAEYYGAYVAHENGKLKDSIEGKAAKEDIELLKHELQSARDAQAAENAKLMDALKTQGLAINRSLRGQDVQPKTVKSILSENMEMLKGIKSGEINGMRTIDMSGLKDMTFGGNITGEIPQAFRIPGYNELPLRPLSFLSTLRQSNTAKPTISWVYRATRTGAPAATSEAATKPLAESTFAEGSEAVSKITARTRVSMEMLDDIEFMNDAINADLFSRLMLQVETGSYSGTGAAGPPQLLRGVRTVASAFAAPTGLAAAIDNANELDVLSAAFTQINLAFQPVPTHIFMNPVDVALMRAYKVSTTDRRYVETLYETAEGLNFMGARIVPTPLVTQDTYLLGYMPFATLYNRMAPSLAIGLSGDDFAQNMRTLLSEWRGAVVVKNNDRTAFVAGTFSTDKTALETT